MIEKLRLALRSLAVVSSIRHLLIFDPLYHIPSSIAPPFVKIMVYRRGVFWYTVRKDTIVRA
jgi:hypothetical protein